MSRKELANAIRALSMDAVQKANSGHPGAPMGMADIAEVLWNDFLKHNPNDPTWYDRDRFILSNGHASMLLYSLLHLSGYNLPLEELKNFRQLHSKTPGHPEIGYTPGVETTTGPLGQGLASAVGMAMAARYERGLFDPETPSGKSPFDHFIYVIASDGDVQEGVTAEASSLAGTQQLGNLIAIYDDNEISIEDNTRIALNEDVAARYEAYGWHVQTVNGREDVAAIEEAIADARAVTDKPSLIVLRTVIAFPAPTMMNTGASHGAALGQDEVDAVKEALGMGGTEPFTVEDEVISHTRAARDRGARVHAQWSDMFHAWAEANPERKTLFDRLYSGELPDGWDAGLPTWDADSKGVATRRAPAEAIQALGATLPELWGGSADLAGSNNTPIKGADSFGPSSISTDTWTASPYGRNLHFGVREHAMGAILNGIALHGPTRPYGGTFLIFSEYMRPAVRLAALQGSNAYYVWTHDSIGLGEDGPTHQPVEQLAALRAIPGLAILRPADANETAASWRAMLEALDGPKGLCLTRQDVPVLEGTKELAREGVERGGYVLAEASTGTPEVILMGTGSEVQLAVQAREVLEAEGVATRVVSMPCVEFFDQQDAGYRESVLPRSVRARVSVEAGIAMPWHRFLGDAGRAVSLEHFGASAPYQTLFTEFGITADAVVSAARESLAAAAGEAS